MEECLFPVRCRQHVWHAFLHHIWTSRNPGLGQREDPHPPLRILNHELKCSADVFYVLSSFLHVLGRRLSGSQLWLRVGPPGESLNHTDDTANRRDSE